MLDIIKSIKTVESIEQRFSVNYHYSVYFTESLFSHANPLLFSLFETSDDHHCKAVIIIDEGVSKAWPNLSDDIKAYFNAQGCPNLLAGDPEIINGGELVKNDHSLVLRLQKLLKERHIDRHSYVIAIGGGAVLDVVGYVAATTHRGLRHIRIPTTVLSQNDSGVGVKNGVNAFGIKNFLGSFAPPYAVINDCSFLKTLHHRDRRSGLAEAVKVALIRDAEFFTWMEQNAEKLANFDCEAEKKVIKRCAELHLEQISQGGDPFESGNVRPLDYGHWSAHKLESLTQYALRHGEAVAIGIALDTIYSESIQWLSRDNTNRVLQLLKALGFQLWHAALNDTNQNGDLSVLTGLEDFREHLGGVLSVTLLRDIGIGEEVQAMDHNKVKQAIDRLCRLFA